MGRDTQEENKIDNIHIRIVQEKSWTILICHIIKYKEN